MISAKQILDDSPFVAYSYSYPHKTAYRRLPRPVPLKELWSKERRDALFLYLHLPFCRWRCGYCNLFTTADPEGELVTAYLDAVERQARRVRDSLGDARFAQLAIGGGTPTFLDASQLERLLGVAEKTMGARPSDIPVSVEASPATVTADKLELLRQFGVDRLSIGVQCFDDEEMALLGRRQRRDEAERALDQIREAGFPTLNIDLIYGGPGRTLPSWLESVRSALKYEPEELYLYPLYVRKLTGLQDKQRSGEDRRLEAYRAARGMLLAAGYEQVSLRLFRSPRAVVDNGPVYRCQEDGMIGIGCGARSYTKALHYSYEYAVRRENVLSIIRRYVGRRDDEFSRAEYGFELDEEDQRRRYAIKSLLTGEGLDRSDYAQWFGSDPLEDIPRLGDLEPLGLAATQAERIRLTPDGLERSDVIGPFLYSDKVRRLMEEYRPC